MTAATPDHCSKCNTPRAFERVAPFPPGQEATIGVAWRCPSCDERTLVICALGPVIPAAGSCLNCGADRERGAACSSGVLAQPRARRVARTATGTQRDRAGAAREAGGARRDRCRRGGGGGR